MAGHMGAERVTQRGLTVVESRSRAAPAPRQGRRAGPEERGRRDQRGRVDGRQGAGPRRGGCEGARTSTLDGGRLRRRGQAASRPRDRPRRGRGRSGRNPRGEEPRHGRRRHARSRGARRAPAGRARGRPALRSGRAAAWPFRRDARSSTSRSTGRRGRRRCAAHSRTMPAGARWRSSTAAAFGDAPSTRTAAAFLEAWGKERPLLVVVTPRGGVLAKSFRNLASVLVLEPLDARGRRALVWARSLLFSEARSSS